MIRPSNRVFWLLIGLVALALAVVLIRPLRQLFGVAIWDGVLVPIYAASSLLIGARGLLCGSALLLFLLTPFFLSPLWDALGVLDSAAMALARRYYSNNSRLVRYGLDRETHQDRDLYAGLRGWVLRIGDPLRGLRRVPILGDLHRILFDEAPSVRVALLLLNRIHESAYFAARQSDSDLARLRGRWQVTATAAQALAGHVLAGPVRSPETRLIGALLYDDLHSQGFAFSARTRLILPRRVPVWRDRALALYRRLAADLQNVDADSPNNPLATNAAAWSGWVTLRLLWLSAFGATGSGSDRVLDWTRLSVIEEQFWRLSELADSIDETTDETATGIAIAAAQRLATDLVSLIVLGGGPSAPDLLRFGTDLGHWLDTTADGRRASVWHSAPSSRASELPPATFLASQLIAEIGPKYAPHGESTTSDALRAQLIAARSAIYALIQGGWQHMVPEPTLLQAQALTQRAMDEIAIEDDFGGRS